MSESTPLRECQGSGIPPWYAKTECLCDDHVNLADDQHEKR